MSISSWAGQSPEAGGIERRWYGQLPDATVERLLASDVCVYVCYRGNCISFDEYSLKNVRGFHNLLYFEAVCKLHPFGVRVNIISGILSERRGIAHIARIGCKEYAAGCVTVTNVGGSALPTQKNHSLKM